MVGGITPESTPVRGAGELILSTKAGRHCDAFGRSRGTCLLPVLAALRGVAMIHPMQSIVLNNARTGATARILPEAGFNLFQLRIPVSNQVVEVLDSEPGFETTGTSPSHSGVPLLFPFP